MKIEEDEMTTEAAETKFTGYYSEQLKNLAELIDWLWAEHGKSFVKAGDDEVFAFGGNGFVLVLDQMKWAGTIEMMTPDVALTIRPGDDGKLAVTSNLQDEKAVKEAFDEGIRGVRRYYENRYWSTPKISS